MGSNPNPSQTERLHNWYLSPPCLVLGITRMGQGLGSSDQDNVTEWDIGLAIEYTSLYKVSVDYILLFAPFIHRGKPVQSVHRLYITICPFYPTHTSRGAKSGPI